MNIQIFIDTSGQKTPVNRLFYNIRQIGSAEIAFSKIHPGSYIGGKQLKIGVYNHNSQRLTGQIMMEQELQVIHLLDCIEDTFHDVILIIRDCIEKIYVMTYV